MFIGGDGENGPLRVGIFARVGRQTRIQTGATFFGILDMSGNVSEPVITANLSPSTYTGEWGDGMLLDNGNYDVATWPSVESVALYPYPVGARGASFDDGVSTRPNTAIEGLEGELYPYIKSAGTNLINVSNRSESRGYQFSPYKTGGRGVR